MVSMVFGPWLVVMASPVRMTSTGAAPLSERQMPLLSDAVVPPPVTVAMKATCSLGLRPPQTGWSMKK